MWRVASESLLVRYPAADVLSARSGRAISRTVVGYEVHEDARSLREMGRHRQLYGEPGRIRHEPSHAGHLHYVVHAALGPGGLMDSALPDKPQYGSFSDTW